MLEEKIHHIIYSIKEGRLAALCKGIATSHISVFIQGLDEAGLEQRHKLQFVLLKHGSESALTSKGFPPKLFSD